jgi:hypothetical protein
MAPQGAVAEPFVKIEAHKDCPTLRGAAAGHTGQNFCLLE